MEPNVLGIEEQLLPTKILKRVEEVDNFEETRMMKMRKNVRKPMTDDDDDIQVPKFIHDDVTKMMMMIQVPKLIHDNESSTSSLLVLHRMTSSLNLNPPCIISAPPPPPPHPHTTLPLILSITHSVKLFMQCTALYSAIQHCTDVM